ncbi:hypothetical protein ACNKHU_24090 [Shigella flexneri]
MTKMVDTNYHYMVPEFVKGRQFKLTGRSCWRKWTRRSRWATTFSLCCWGGYLPVAAGKVKGEQFDRLSLLNDILPVYQQVLAELAKRGIEWVQIDEPALVLELPQAWLDASNPLTTRSKRQVELLLTTYFAGVRQIWTRLLRCLFRGCMLTSYMVKMTLLNCTSACLLTGCCRGSDHGRNVLRADLTEKYSQIKDIVGKRDLWVASSCSLLHSPIDRSVETRLMQK